MKIHLAYADEPLQSGQDAYAVCGAVISKAEFPFIFDLEFPDAAHLNSITICTKCYAYKREGRYLYGIVPGQEAMTA